MNAARQPPPDLFDFDAAEETPSGTRLVADPPKAKSLPPGAMSISRFASEPPSRPDRRGDSFSKSSMGKAREQARAMAQSGEWSDATSSHFVALYEYFHTVVYEVAPAELSVAREWANAAAAAARLLHAQFADDPAAMASFMRWVWRKEQETETWRRANKRSGRSIGWRLQFSEMLVTQWRIDGRRTTEP